MTLQNDTLMGPYKILSPVGAGGMGEVYLARDTKLDRDVAVKVLPESLSRDKERLARFHREAKLLASLNHPNIAAIYGFDEVDGKALLVMELAEGETLAKRLGSGALPVDDALDIGKQIAEALEAAHDGGIIHRDLKPANVMVAPDGKVKVLDFGLAKAILGVSDSSRSEMANSPTITANFTQPGIVLGTAAYMSPEQARGKPLDKRTDIWSFGCILYELLTGDRIFGGETTSDAIGAILHKEPEWTALPVDVPPTVQLLLRRCLSKDRNHRLRDIGDARIELHNAIHDPTSSSLRFADSALAAEERRAGRASRSVLRSTGVLMLVVIAAGIAWTFKPESAPLGRIVAQIPAPKESRVLYAGDVAGPVVVSPDGSMVAFVAQERGKRQQIWLRQLQEMESRPIRGTERASFPFWSHDSRSLGFFAGGKLKRVDLSTGTTRRLCSASGGRGGTWLKNNVIVLSPEFQDGLYQVSADGGTPTLLTELDASRHTSHRWPARVGDGNHFLFTAINHDPGKSEDAAIYLGSLDGAPPRKIVRNLLNAEYISGYMLFVRDTVLMAVPLDLGTAEIRGEVVPIARDVAPDLSTWRAAYSASPAGVLAYHSVSSTTDSDVKSSDVSLGVGAEANVSVKYDRTGRPLTQIAEGVSQMALRIGPNNKLAMSVIDDREFGIDLWIYDMGVTGDAPQQMAKQRVTSMPFVETAPVWSPDGEELAFAHIFVGDATDAIYRKRIGGGVAHKLVEAQKDLQVWPTDWSSDGKYLIYTTGIFITGLKSDIHVLPLDGGEPFPYVATDKDEFAGRLSPNGKWLAYNAESGGASEVYVVPFNPESVAATGEGLPSQPQEQWQISVGGGNAPCWRGDGKELFYMSEDGVLMAVAVDTDGEDFSIGATTRLFQTAFEPGKSFDVQPDGQKFVINEVTVNVDTPISLIVNWNEVLNR